jgi:hypothetical protein
LLSFSVAENVFATRAALYDVYSEWCSQQKLAEETRISRAMVHFQNDENFTAMQNSNEKKFLAETQDLERTHLKQRLEVAADAKKERIKQKVAEKQRRQADKVSHVTGLGFPAACAAACRMTHAVDAMLDFCSFVWRSSGIVKRRRC